MSGGAVVAGAAAAAEVPESQAALRSAWSAHVPGSVPLNPTKGGRSATGVAALSGAAVAAGAAVEAAEPESQAFLRSAWSGHVPRFVPLNPTKAGVAAVASLASS